MILQRIPTTARDPRPETGPMQFGDDWPGVFIRGDNAFHYMNAAMCAIKELDKDFNANWPAIAGLKNLVSLLDSSNARNHYPQVTEEEEDGLV